MCIRDRDRHTGLRYLDQDPGDLAPGLQRVAADVALKWPHDVLVRGDALQPWRKVAGILIEVPQPGMAILGIGCNVDWHDHEPPRGGPGGLGAASLAEVKGAPVDRWRVL